MNTSSPGTSAGLDCHRHHLPLAGITAGQNKSPNSEEGGGAASPTWLCGYFSVQNLPELLLIHPGHGFRCSCSSQGLKQIGERQNPAVRAHSAQKCSTDQLSFTWKIAVPMEGDFNLVESSKKKPQFVLPTQGSEMGFSQGTKGESLFFFPPLLVLYTSSLLTLLARAKASALQWVYYKLLL